MTDDITTNEDTQLHHEYDYLACPIPLHYLKER
jgi:hypothetical protein